MVRRIALLYLALASPLMLVLFLLPWPAAETSFALLVAGFPVALIAMAAERRGRLGPLGPPLLALLILLEGCTVGMLALRGHVLDGPWFGGLPMAAAMQLYGVWLAPLLIVALAYALTFDRFALRRDDLDRLQRYLRERDGDDR